jgi:hypothetical protein
MHIFGQVAVDQIKLGKNQSVGRVTPYATSSATLMSETVIAEPALTSSAESILKASFPAPQTLHFH